MYPVYSKIDIKPGRKTRIHNPPFETYLTRDSVWKFHIGFSINLTTQETFQRFNPHQITFFTDSQGEPMVYIEFVYTIPNLSMTAINIDNYLPQLNKETAKRRDTITKFGADASKSSRP